jgi:hypothetical protein
LANDKPVCIEEPRCILGYASRPTQGEVEKFVQRRLHGCRLILHFVPQQAPSYKRADLALAELDRQAPEPLAAPIAMQAHACSGSGDRSGTAIGHSSIGHRSIDHAAAAPLDMWVRSEAPQGVASLSRWNAGTELGCKAARAERQHEKRARRVVRERDLGDKIASGNLDLPALFGVILADPQWGRTVYSEETGMDRHAANHYPTAAGTEATQDDAIKALRVVDLAATHCVLGL